MVRYCQCGIPGIPGVQCPVRWDRFDGKSITQTQSDQYKVRKNESIGDEFFQAEYTESNVSQGRECIEHVVGNRLVDQHMMSAG